MKVKTSINYVGQKINANGKEYQFDNAGLCEIEDENEAKALIEKHPKMFFDVKAKKEKQLTVVEEYTAENVQKLNTSIQLYKEEIKELKATINKKDVEVETWKAKAQELIDKGDGDLEGLTEENKTLKHQVAILEFKCELFDSSVPLLKEACEQGQYPKEEWEKKNKSELIDYLISKKNT